MKILKLKSYASHLMPPVKIVTDKSCNNEHKHNK